MRCHCLWLLCTIFIKLEISFLTRSVIWDSERQGSGKNSCWLKNISVTQPFHYEWHPPHVLSPVAARLCTWGTKKLSSARWAASWVEDCLMSLLMLKQFVQKDFSEFIIQFYCYILTVIYGDEFQFVDTTDHTTHRSTDE